MDDAWQSTHIDMNIIKKDAPTTPNIIMKILGMLQTFSVHVTTMLQAPLGTLMWEVLGAEHDKVK